MGKKGRKKKALKRKVKKVKKVKKIKKAIKAKAMKPQKTKKAVKPLKAAKPAKAATPIKAAIPVVAGKIHKAAKFQKHVEALAAATKMEKAKPKLGKKKQHIAYLGLGSNVGDREEYIEQAVFLLSKTPGIDVTKRSTNYETEPEGNTDQPAFLNAAVEIKTKLEPHDLLATTQETENALGREREVEWGPRTIDIDILFYDDEIVSDDKLQIPHPLIHERMFALMPLAEIAPRLEHPLLEKPIEQLLEERKNEIGEKYDDELPGFKDIKKGAADDYERW